MSLPAGQYYPRIGRGPWRHQQSPYAGALVAARQQLTLLDGDLNTIFTYVHPHTSQSEVFGHHIRNLLILAATEFEAQCVGILRANNTQPIGQHFNTNDYVKLNAAMRLDEYELQLSMFPEYPLIAPFANWNANAPTRSLVWYDAYNQTKHNREQNFAAASLHYAICSVAATFAIYMAQALGTDCNAPSLRLPRTFVATKWPKLSDVGGRYQQPADRTTWTPVDYPF